MKNLKKKKGFTLIELMIVLAIIGILAVVLVPKVGTLKDSTKNTGITANVGSVRAYLETKTKGNSFYSGSQVLSMMQSDFTGNNALENPFTKDTTLASINAVPTSTAPAAPTKAAYVYDLSNANGAASGKADAFDSTASTSTAIANAKGSVFIYVYKDGYVVFGIDNLGNGVNEAVIK